MSIQFQFKILSISGDSIEFSLSEGDVLYVVGANGTGKSSLVSQLFGQHQQNAKRVSAHRQIAEKNWDGLLIRYKLRESSAFDRAVNGLKIKVSFPQACKIFSVFQLFEPC
jgi:ABC-type Mn2+/Zn2+ transport system ATPase subunit